MAPSTIPQATKPLRACRGCLTMTSKLQKISELTRKVFFTICGLKIEPEDGYPQYLCYKCYTFVNKTLAFRRKTRRAFFALKEIVFTKKELTMKDIQKINRSTINLVSPLGCWNPETSAVYSVTPEFDETDINIEQQQPEENTKSTQEKQVMDGVKQYTNTSKILNFSLDKEPGNNFASIFDIKVDQGKQSIEISLKDDQNKSSSKDELVKCPPDIKGKSQILVDIKPANYLEIERLEEEKRLEERRQEEEEALRQIRAEDSHFDDIDDGKETDVDAANIDLNDVFKGLVEDETKTDDDLSEIVPTRKMRKITRVAPRKKKINKPEVDVTQAVIADRDLYTKPLPLRRISRAKLRYLTPEEQRQVFQLRKELEPYKSAGFRCSMCLVTFQSEFELLRHVKFRHTAQEEKCDICKARFKDNFELEIHQSREHWYEYTCACGQLMYTLKDLIACIHTPETEVVLNEREMRERKREEDEYLREAFRIKLSPPEKWSETILDVTERKSCSFCGEDFEKKRVFEGHGVLVCRTGPTQDCKCSVCERDFKTLQALETHFENNHARTYHCRHCRKICDRSAALEHKCIRKNLRYSNAPHHCTECGLSFKTRNQIVYHQIQMHFIIWQNIVDFGDPRFVCVPCEAYFRNERAFITHQLYTPTHETLINTEIACKKCKLVFETEEQKREHDDSRHTHYPAQCSKCEKTVASKEERLRHMKEAHPQDRRKALKLCDICGVYINNFLFPQHVARHERQGDDYTPSAKLLKTKQMTIHCKLCPNKSLSAKAFVVHMLRNHIPRPFCCGICGQRFVERCQCKDHILKIHAPEKPFACAHCDIRFSCREYHEQHSIKVHGLASHKAEAKKRMEAFASMCHKFVVCYPHMKIDMSHIPVQHIEEAGILLYDYADENFELIPTESLLDYLVLDPERELGQVPRKQNKKKSRRKRKIADEGEKEKGKENKRSRHSKQNKEPSPEKYYIEEDEKIVSVAKEYEMSYVRDENGGFSLKSAKTELQIDTVSEEEVKLNESNQTFDNKLEVESDAFDRKTKQGFYKSDQRLDETNQGLDETNQGLDETNQGLDETNEGLDEKPFRLEIDAQELAQKYEVVELDGLQYVNIDNVLYKIEYS